MMLARWEQIGVGHTIERVRTLGLGIKTSPTMFVPSSSGSSLISKDVTLKPVSLFKPRES